MLRFLVLAAALYLCWRYWRYRQARARRDLRRQNGGPERRDIQDAEFREMGDG